MRPRLITAENPDVMGIDGSAVGASMRPRLITAENGDGRKRRFWSAAGFNEAAAHHRGEPAGAQRRSHETAPASMRPRLITAENFVRRQAFPPHAVPASMRPRLITAENFPAAGGARIGRGCFNEAAAHHRGERPCLADPVHTRYFSGVTVV